LGGAAGLDSLAYLLGGWYEPVASRAAAVLKLMGVSGEWDELRLEPFDDF
jgi:hypothetical protein